MEPKDVIANLRKQSGLSQDELAEKLFVTRQAISRWETGETTPNTDTLKLISKQFGVSINTLLGEPEPQCQSCGMILSRSEDMGTDANGGKSSEYCAFCFQNGVFHDATMEEIIEHNLEDLEEWNRSAGLSLTPEQAREMLREYLPTLTRWKK